MSNFGWIGVDLDGTLAVYDGWHGPRHIGEPVPAMVERIKTWINEGKDVRIFTARVFGIRQGITQAETKELIEAWCLVNIGRVLPVTCEKDFGMIELWDDRAVSVEKNTGRIIGTQPPKTLCQLCQAEIRYVQCVDGHTTEVK